jgi:DNA invertase Pin-like site-specific DNA recombinase
MIFGYCRVSTADQAADGTTSLEEQERKCWAIATLRGADSFNFTCFKDAGVSGTIPLDHRPGGSAMLEAATTGDVLIATKIDRMFRSTIDALKTMERLKERGIDVILADLNSEPVTSNGVGKLVFGLMAMFADFERERIAERMEDGRHAKRRNNGFLGGQPPFGFKVEGEGRQARLIPDDHEQHVVRLVERLARRNSHALVVKELAQLGYKGRDGKPIGYMQINRMLEGAKKRRATNPVTTHEARA